MPINSPFEKYSDWTPNPFDENPDTENTRAMSALFDVMEGNMKGIIANSTRRNEFKPDLNTTRTGFQKYFELFDVEGNRVGGISATVDRAIEPNSGFLGAHHSLPKFLKISAYYGGNELKNVEFVGQPILIRVADSNEAMVAIQNLTNALLDHREHQEQEKANRMKIAEVTGDILKDAQTYIATLKFYSHEKANPHIPSISPEQAHEWMAYFTKIYKELTNSNRPNALVKAHAEYVARILNAASGITV